MFGNELIGRKFGDCNGVEDGVLEGEVMLNITGREVFGELGPDFFLAFSSVVGDCAMESKKNLELFTLVLILVNELKLDKGK